MNAAEEAVEEEWSPSKSCLQQLYLDKILAQLLHLVFVFAPAANLVTDEFSCQSDEINSQQDKLIYQGQLPKG